MEKCQKMPKFQCTICNFISSKKSNYNTHISTRKHIDAVEVETSGNILETEETAKNAAAGSQLLTNTTCSLCSKKYKTRSGLWKHTQICSPGIKPIIHVVEPVVVEEVVIEKKETPNNIETILSLFKENEEIRNMMIEQNAKIIELMNAKPLTAITNITNNNNNNTINNQFNLNLFLNETCRDAMNITEFIENIDIQMRELENVANNGYVAGITDIILTRLKQLDVSKRPLHCTDLKRETLYIKDKNEWNRDTEENSKIKNMITKVAHKNYRKIPKWREQNPECQEPENEKYSFCINMMRNSLGDLGDEQVRLDEKIIKNIAKLVVVDKNV